MKFNSSNILYKDMPSFGVDIGHSSIKVMQLEKNNAGYFMQGYGLTQLNHSVTENGIVSEPEKIASKIYELITTSIKGKITFTRVAFSIPNEFSYSRIIQLPKMSKKDLLETIDNELSASMPLPLSELYYDYDVVSLNDQQEVQLVATPKTIIDSYLSVSDMLGIEPAFIQTNIGAVTRTVINTEVTKDRVTLIIDFGSSAADLTLFDGNEIRITSTANCGGENMTKAIANELGCNTVQAHIIKTRYGVDPSKKQKLIKSAVSIAFEALFEEIKKVNKYIQDRTDGKIIEQIIIVGGGSNMPGISGFMTEYLKIPCRLCNPWKNIDLRGIDKPDPIDAMLYTTAIGLAMGNEKDFIK